MNEFRSILRDSICEESGEIQTIVHKDVVEVIKFLSRCHRANMCLAHREFHGKGRMAVAVCTQSFLIREWVLG